MKTYRNLGIYFLVFITLFLFTSTSFVTAESTFERIRRTRVLRMAGQLANAPFWVKDITTGEWSGFAIDMGRDLAKEMDVKLEVVESGWAQSVLDLQTRKIDISLALSATPNRALSVDFTRRIYDTPFGAIVRPGYEKEVKYWEDLNDPKVRIVTHLGTTYEMYARRYAPKAQILVYKSFDEVIMAMLGGRGDFMSTGLLQGVTTVTKNRKIGKYVILEPVVSGPVAAAVPRETDKTFRDFVSVWADFNRGMGNIREWLLKSLYATGAKPSDIPRGLQF